MLCTHGDVIRRTLERLRDLGAVLPGDLECCKGSTWLIELPDGNTPRAVYLPPLCALPGARTMEHWPSAG